MQTKRFVIGAVLAAVMVTSAPMAHSADMLYLVRGTFIDPGVLMPPSERVTVLKELVFPSLDMLAKWQKEGKVTGGLPVGAREGYMILKASSHEAADRMLHELPFWGLLKWEVTPLGSFADRVALERQKLTELMGSR